ncbi:MAG: IclR family transcriptional regulator [Gammaproteobacteria bacterium]|nr:MAG: IclR family transcriptional regulator [Gammaproteobacteria bacterium]
MDKQYTSKAQMRGYQTLKALFGHEINGITCHELAAQLNKPKVTVYKDLKGLEAAGLAEQLPDKNWRLSSALAREAVKIMHNLDAARRRVDETAGRYGLG